MIETIVVGYDGSAVGDRALGRAGELAGAFGSNIVVVVVDEIPVIPSAAPVGMADVTPVLVPDDVDRSGFLEARIDRARSRLGALGSLCEVVTPIGAADVAILEVADDRDADLIVVGTNEPGFFERLFVGSVSGTVARTANCDVLVVHGKESEGHGEESEEA